MFSRKSFEIAANIVGHSQRRCHSNAKIRVQSFLMRMTVQTIFFVSSCSARMPRQTPRNGQKIYRGPSLARRLAPVAGATSKLPPSTW